MVTTRTSRPPFHADQVGSLLRPPELLKARADFAEGKVDRDYLRYEEDRAILDVIALQRQIGDLRLQRGHLGLHLRQPGL